MACILVWNLKLYAKMDKGTQLEWVIDGEISQLLGIAFGV